MLRQIFTLLAMLTVPVTAVVAAQTSTDAEAERSVATATEPLPANDRATWVLWSDLPPDVRGSGFVGRVQVELDVDPSGRVSGCRVAVSSGNPVIDQVTCTRLYERARLYPARDSEGRNVAGVFRTAVAFQNGVERPTAPEPVDRTLSFVIERDGQVTSCSGVTRVGTVDPGDNPCPQGLRLQPMLDAAGQPVRVRIEVTQTIVHEVLPD